MASGNLLLVQQPISTIAPHPAHLSGILQLGLGTLAKFQTSHISCLWMQGVHAHTHSVKLSRDVTFDESCFPSQQGTETPLPNSPIPIPFFLATAAPNTVARPLNLQAPSSAPFMGSKEDVKN